MDWKKVMRTGNFRRKVDLSLKEILEGSKSRQITNNESIIEKNSSTGEIPVNKTSDKISGEAKEVIVNADFEDEHNWDTQKWVQAHS
ncbi:hypothetical protein JTB14_021577 [Gonioctena quinquepunctata]|nr:hypothetical protein JTB14_021577 [Gonioctena quinquepunctata]